MLFANNLFLESSVGREQLWVNEQHIPFKSLQSTKQKTTLCGCGFYAFLVICGFLCFFLKMLVVLKNVSSKNVDL